MFVYLFCFIASVLNIKFLRLTEDVWNVRPKWGQKPGFCEQDVLVQELINSVSLPLKTNHTCCSVLISPWRIWRAQSSKFTTPLCHGWAVRITMLSTTFMILLETELLSSLGSLLQTSVPAPVLSFSESEVALRTREGHVLTFSLSSNLTTTLLDNSSLVSYSAWRPWTDLTIDWLVTADSWTNCTASPSGAPSRLRERTAYRRREPKKELGEAAVSAHFPVNTSTQKQGIFQAGGSVWAPPLRRWQPYVGHWWGAFSRVVLAGWDGALLRSRDTLLLSLLLLLGKKKT